jgi:hypothetical protein
LREDPSLLGLGNLFLKDKERPHPRAGRLDLLRQDPDSNRRYEVEIQLGKTDEGHIIRTIEYWDVERKRYPQYDHAAVIVAEEMTSRFLNVISLFNGSIPLIAIQLNAVRLGDQVSLVFTTVLDEIQLGLVEEDEEVQAVTNRSYWEERGKCTAGCLGRVSQLDHCCADRLRLLTSPNFKRPFRTEFGVSPRVFRRTVNATDPQPAWPAAESRRSRS